MANVLEKSIFFPGGSIIFPKSTDDYKGLKFTKIVSKEGEEEKKYWQITIDLKIPEAETIDVIKEYEDFDPVPASVFAEKYPNQVYFEAFDEQGSKYIRVLNVELYTLNSHENSDGGKIVLIMTPPTGVGKTQNPNTKTQNPQTGTSTSAGTSSS